MQPSPTPDIGPPPRFRIADLEVDIGKAEVTRGGEKIALPKLSFDLLCALINAAPSIVTNDELLARVWPGLMVSPESVAQRVKLLRSAIGDDSQQPKYILGVRGRGYRLIPVVERLTESTLPTDDAAFPPTNTPGTTIPGRPTLLAPTVNRSNRRRVVIGAAVLVVVGVVVGVGWHYWSSRTAQPTTVAMADKSIAVLPFADMSEKKDQEYFGDGMAEEIIDLLVRIPGLKVIGRTSSFTFKGKAEDLRSIGTQLGVAYVLEGSVRKSGDRVRVTAQLIDSRDGNHLFSQTYDRDVIDVLKMQDEIAIRVAQAFEFEVFIRNFVSRPALRNEQAYTLFLQGQHANSWEQSVSDTQRALDLDPTFKEAAVALAGAYQYGGFVGFVPSDVAYEKSRHFSELALKLDPNFAMAHAFLGSIYSSYAWDWPAADREIDQALRLAPSSTFVMWAALTHALTMGRWDDALKYVSAHVELDPLDPDGYFWMSVVQSNRGRLPEAETAIRRALELAPTYPFGPYTLGMILLARNEPQAALTEILKEPYEAARLSGSAMAYFALNRKADSDAALALRIKNFPNNPFQVAEVYAFRGESDEAFQWLDRAYEQKDSLVHGVKYSQPFDNLHNDPRYRAFLRKMNLPD
jgi:TolB-like protein/DNA-binding winged helix-turn-helix (wHTH) protein